MKKIYLEPKTEVFFADLRNSLCQATTGGTDPNSIDNEGESGMDEDNPSKVYETFSTVHSMWED